MSLTRKLRRSKIAQKLVYDALNWMTRHNEDLMTLNCGIVAPNGIQLGKTFTGSPLAQSGLGLYHYVAQESGIDLSDKKLLEIGCGRGGGTAYIVETFRPRFTQAIDFSNQSIQLCQDRYNKIANLCFQYGEATNLPYSAGTFDVILSIETSHMIDEKDRFFSESSRVAKLGSKFLYLDFLYTRNSSDHSAQRIDTAIRHSDWEIESKVDLTRQVLESLNQTASIREALIESKCPKILQRQVQEFCMTRQSNAFQAFLDGRTRYVFYTLKKP